MSDASDGSQPEFLDEWATHENSRSRGAKLILADTDIVGQRSVVVHLTSFGGTVMKRVFNSTIEAEQYELTGVVEKRPQNNSEGSLRKASMADLPNKTCGKLAPAHTPEDECRQLPHNCLRGRARQVNRAPVEAAIQAEESTSGSGAKSNMRHAIPGRGFGRRPC